jgi:hypothetical protein
MVGKPTKLEAPQIAYYFAIAKISNLLSVSTAEGANQSIHYIAMQDW